MEAIALLFSKFSDEFIGAQLGLLFFAVSLAIYWALVRRKKQESAEWVPAALVKAYLDRMRADEYETRLKLFGTAVPPMSVPSGMAGVAPTVVTVTGMDPAVLKELEALRAQLSLSDQRIIDFDKIIAGLKADKAALEDKLKNAPAATAGTPEVAAMSKELEDLRAKLGEYSVIEDDLANLKKYQKENEQLKVRLEQLEKGKPELTVVSGGAAKPAEPVAVIPAAAAAPAEAPVNNSNTNMLQPVNPGEAAAPVAAAPAPAPEAAPAAAAPVDAKSKEEALLSEFEKMLAS